MTTTREEKATTNAMKRALTAASLRERGNICPIRGVHAAAENALIKAMDERGYIAWNGQPWHSAPYISEAGRAVVKAVQS